MTKRNLHFGRWLKITSRFPDGFVPGFVIPAKAGSQACLSVPPLLLDSRLRGNDENEVIFCHFLIATATAL